MAFDATRTLRGALAGAAAAAVWAAQQPLDKRVFGVDYDDAELLGRLARVRGAAAGLAEHLATWPGTLVIDRLSLGRDLPKLWGDPRAFAQATWRHLLFG